MQFFLPPREHFFRPLTHDNRELCAAVLRRLHERVHGVQADYAQALTRELVLELIQQTLAEPALRALAFAPGQPVSAPEERSYAAELLRKLKEHGWLEDYRDPIDLRPTLKLSRAGKAFSETLAQLDDSRAKTRQRNMRSARKALAAFMVTHDVDELLDAHEFAARVVQDLQDDIEYFRQLIQHLTREALEQRLAWSEFNEFIETRFAREYAVRLVADSAERHRGAIADAVQALRELPEAQRQAADAHLQQRAPWLERDLQGRSALLWLADRIEAMVEAACHLKLPMLRAEMHNYVRRFTSLLRQALSLDYGAESALGRCLAWLKEREAKQREALLDALAQRLGPAETRLVGGALRWNPREREAPAAVAAAQIDPASRLDAALRRAESEAFALSDQDVLSALLPRLLEKGALRLSELPVGSAAEALELLHAVGAARSAEGRTLLQAQRREERLQTPYFDADDYLLRLAPTDP